MALQTSTRPLVGEQVDAEVPPATMAVSSTDETDQSAEAVERWPVHVPEVLLPNFNVNELLVRAQWYLFHEWLALVSDGKAARMRNNKNPAKANTDRLFINPPFIINILPDERNHVNSLKNFYRFKALFTTARFLWL